MDVAVATGALAWGPSIGGATATLSVLGRWGVAAVTGSFRMRAGQGPDTVVDARRVPPALRVTLRTTPGSHFRGELIPMRIVMTVDAGARVERETESGTLASVTTRTRNGLVPPLERKPRTAMLLHGERRRPETVLVVTARTVGRSKLPAMGIAMAVSAALEPQPAIPSRGRKLRGVTALARDLSMQAFECEAGLWVGAKPNLSW